jgi:formylglycine-generating enzyme required for sulfatase activity
VRRLLNRFFDHIRPPADEELFRRVETCDGPVDLWQKIPAGEGRIGSPKGVGYDDERPRYRVEVVRPFWLAAVPVTNGQYAAFDPDKPWEKWEGVEDEELRHHPVVEVTWYEAVSFCRWLSTVPGLAGARLPSEEEWEYACRARSETAYWKGNAEEDLSEVGWYDKNSGNRTHRVGEKPANPWGLYDVHGNVWEWTASVWKDDYSGREAGITVDPAAAPADLAAPPGGGRVVRGGGCWNDADRARSAFRSRWVTGWVFRDRGFRVLAPVAPSSIVDH